MDHATAGSFLGISGVVWFWILTIIGVGGLPMRPRHTGPVKTL